MKQLIFIIIILLLIGCTSVTLGSTPDATPTLETPDLEVLNFNPTLQNPTYTTVMFYTETWGREYVSQDIPEGYTLYERGVPYAWPIIWTEAGYTYLPGGKSGSVGFSFEQTLSPGHYAIIIKGIAHVEGPFNEYHVRAAIWAEGQADVINSNTHTFRANGNYQYILEFDIPLLGTYQIAPHWWFQYVTATTSSYIQVHSIELVLWE